MPLETGKLGNYVTSVGHEIVIGGKQSGGCGEILNSVVRKVRSQGVQGKKISEEQRKRRQKKHLSLYKHSSHCLLWIQLALNVLFTALFVTDTVHNKLSETPEPLPSFTYEPNPERHFSKFAFTLPHEPPQAGIPDTLAVYIWTVSILEFKRNIR